MRYVEAPTYYTPPPRQPTVFLAGGITGTPNWQAEAVHLLSGAPLVVFNPRQAAFDIANPSGAHDQIAWEVAHLRMADVTLFWFPACDPVVTVQPIALFELGMALGRGRRIAVGAAPDYPRQLDVQEQCRHARPGLTVRDSLRDVVTDVLAEMAGGLPGAAA